MRRKELPHLRNLVKPALATFTRKTKIVTGGIHIHEAFENVSIEKSKLDNYRRHFGFKEVLPLPYIYLMAQRAQGALMLHKAYTMPIPGTIHLSNELQSFKQLDPDTPFRIEANLDVAYEAIGSLNPVIFVRFIQLGEDVAVCKSSYLVKRKTPKRHQKDKTKRAPEVYQGSTEPTSVWELTKNVCKEYAAVSDDHNPIHKSALAARLVGFKNPIAHGWYVVSRAVAESKGFDHRIDVQFRRPLFVPGHYLFFENTSSDEGSILSICDKSKTVLAKIEVA